MKTKIEEYSINIIPEKIGAGRYQLIDSKTGTIVSEILKDGDSFTTKDEDTFVIQDGVMKLKRKNASNDSNYDMVNHPKHYCRYGVETVEMIRKVWGNFIASFWCLGNAYKYRQRMGIKPNNPIEQDLHKEAVYMSLYNYYKNEWKNATGDPIQTATEEEIEYIVSFAKRYKEFHGQEISELNIKRYGGGEKILPLFFC